MMAKKSSGKLYIVRDGLHNENGRTYLPGQTVRSSAKLGERWPEKFAEVSEETGLPVGIVPPPPEVEETEAVTSGSG